MQDVYKILELPPFSDQSEVKKAYRKLVKVWHPDINPSQQATDQFKKIQEAYELLMDDKKKMAYDLLLRKKHSNQSTRKSTNSRTNKNSNTKSTKQQDPFITWIRTEREAIYEEYYNERIDIEQSWSYHFHFDQKNFWHQYSLFLLGLWLLTFISATTFGFIILPILSILSFIIGCKKD